MKYTIKEIQPDQNHAICQVIQAVGAEYGAIGDGFGPSDPEVLSMSDYYNAAEKSIYYVAVIGGIVVGGSGIAAFNNSREVCELRKLFLLPQNRGMGIGKALTKKCLDFAQLQGYRRCYLDTLSTMTAAIHLYKNMGFKQLDAPLDGTIHGGCDVWMLKNLI